MGDVLYMVAFLLGTLLGALFDSGTPLGALADVPLNLLYGYAGFVLREIVARAIVAAPVAHFAWRKGYSWWGVFLLSLLVMPAAVAAALVVLPRIESGRAVWPKRGSFSLPFRK